MWIARDEDGRLNLFREKPTRESFHDKHIGWWSIDDDECLEIDSSLFPELKWENDPVQVKIIYDSEKKGI